MKYVCVFLLILSFRAFSNSFGEVELRGFHYISKPALPYQLGNYYSLYGNLDYEVEKEDLFFKANGLTEFFFDKSRQFYFTIPELYLSYNYDFKKRWTLESIKVYVGRHIKEWSRADAYWELDTWNPLNFWEPLHPSPNGLIGAFLDISSKNWLLEFYVGGIHPPKVKPKLKKDPKTGKVISTSRWAVIPPETVDLGEREWLRGLRRDIDYLVSFLFDELIHDSYALSFKTWLPKNKDVWIKGSFGYKPVNDIFLVMNRGNSLKISSSEGEKPVAVQKRVSNFPVIQRILAGELGLRYGRFSTLFSVSDNHVKPAKALSEEQQFVRKPKDHTYFSGLVNYQLPLYKNIKSNLKMGYLHSLKGKNDTSSLVGLPHHKIFRGFSFDWTAEFLTSKGLKREFSLRYWQSLNKWEGLLSLNVLYHILPKWYVGGRVNILSGRDNGEDSPSFLGRFRSNDYVSWRTGYVF